MPRATVPVGIFYLQNLDVKTYHPNAWKEIYILFNSLILQ